MMTMPDGVERNGAERRHGSLLWRLVGELGPYRRRMLVIFLVDLLATPLLLLTPVPLKIVVDSVLGAKPLPQYVDVFVPDVLTRTDTRLLLMAAVMQILVVLTVQLQQMLSSVLRVKTGESLTQAVRVKLFAHAQRLSLLRHDSRGVADPVYRIQHDASELQRVTVDGILTTAAAAVTLGTTIVVITALDWQLGLVGLLVSPILMALVHRYRLRVRPRYRAVKGIETDALQIVQEALGALRVVRAFGQEDGEQDRFSRRSGTGVNARIRLARDEGLFGVSVNLVTAVGTAAVLFFGVRHVQSGALTLGELLMILAYLSQLYAPLKTISKKAATLQSALASAERVFEFLDEPPDVVQRRDAVPLARPVGRIEFRGVTMRYGDGPTVLDDVSFRVEPGSRLGIFGATGAGKTTLVTLLIRFYDPVAGQVLLDGVDLRHYRLADLRRHVAFALQDPVLFSTSIAENIRYARPDAGLREVMLAAEQADAHEFISAMASGYDTRVGERGVRLSGGERQRISLARAFLKGARILVLDEPTSSVDVATETRILSAMERLMDGRTSFVIAHRASTLQHCDRTIQLAQGRLVEANRLNDAGVRGKGRVS